MRSQWHAQVKPPRPLSLESRKEAELPVDPPKSLFDDAKEVRVSLTPQDWERLEMMNDPL